MTKPDEPDEKIILFPGSKAKGSEYPIEHFEILPVSRTTPDGRLCFFQAKRSDGTEVWLSFAYHDLAYLVENAAREMGKAMRKSGQIDEALVCSGFHVAHEDDTGALALTLFTAGATQDEDGKISFLLPKELPPDLVRELQEAWEGKPPV
jgi:hypothetical protein